MNDFFRKVYSLIDDINKSLHFPSLFLRFISLFNIEYNNNFQITYINNKFEKESIIEMNKIYKYYFNPTKNRIIDKSTSHYIFFKNYKNAKNVLLYYLQKMLEFENNTKISITSNIFFHKDLNKFIE